MKWLVIVGICLIVGAASWGVIAVWSGENKHFDCDRGFSGVDWQRDKKDTGRAIAACDWLDGRSIASVRRALGRPDSPPHRGWFTWEIGDSSAGIGPSAWFLLLKTRKGIVIESRAETQPV